MLLIWRDNDKGNLGAMGRATGAFCGARLFCASRRAQAAPPATDSHRAIEFAVV